MARLVFLKRTPKEIEIFGGNIFFDIDGKNIGKLTLENQIINIAAGTHTIKMYKSHTYDTFIGFAESTITISEDEELMIKYSAPMMINQPGNMVITDYDVRKEEEIISDRERTIEHDFIVEENRKQEQDEKYKNGVIAVIVVSIIIAVIWGIYYATLIDSIW
ncbi:MAG: hypothetical protein J6A69_11105 [Clostridia bacterium]|nr:hypothetical protein [Clostridia bacterium]